jgi:hypothetical protein
MHFHDDLNMTINNFNVRPVSPTFSIIICLQIKFKKKIKCIDLNGFLLHHFAKSYYYELKIDDQLAYTQ